MAPVFVVPLGELRLEVDVGDVDNDVGDVDIVGD
jgi:hypothetical protein